MEERDRSTEKARGWSNPAAMWSQLEEARFWTTICNYPIYSCPSFKP
jgi:hypothetical protein